MGTRPPGAEEATPRGNPGAAEEEEATRPVLRCRTCGVAVADPEDALSVGGQPAVRSFVNPHGFVHEVLTLRQAPGMVSGGARYGADSWFPGYAWQFGACRGCGAHLGWQYSARSSAVPATFAGLRKAAVVESEG